MPFVDPKIRPVGSHKPVGKRLIAMAARNKRKVRKTRTRSGGPRSKRRIFAAFLSKRSLSARDRGLHVIAAMRRDPKLSFTRACRLVGVKPETVLAYFSSAFTRSHGQIRVRRSDRFAAVLCVPDANGNPVPVETHSSKEREQLSRYLRDLGRYLRGQRNALAAWHGKKIAGVELLTAGRAIVAIEPALSDFSLYRAFNGGAV